MPALYLRAGADHVLPASYFVTNALEGAPQRSKPESGHNQRMPNLASVLRAEVARIARKELRGETDSLRKTVASQRTEIAALKRRLSEVEKSLKTLARTATKGKARAAAAPAEEGDGSHVRFSAKGMASNRQRLGLSAADFGLLVGTTGQSIYGWESGKSKPRPRNLAAIMALRGVGKREVAARLEQLKGAAE